MTAVFSSILAMVVLGAEPGGMGLPFGIPPGPDDPVIARVAPERCLLYVNWAGTAAPNPNSPSQAEQLLAEPEVQVFFAAVDKCLKAAMKGTMGDNQDATAAAKDAAKGAPAKKAPPFLYEDAFEYYKVFLTRPTAIFISDMRIAKKKPEDAKGAKPKEVPGKKNEAKPADKAQPRVPTPPGLPLESPAVGSSDSPYKVDIHGGVVVSLGGQAAGFKAAVEKYVKATSAGQTGPGEGLDRVQIAGQTWYRGKTTLGDGMPIVVFGFKGNCFVVGIGEGSVEAILARMNAKQPPAWLTAALAKVPVQRRTGIVYLNLKAIGETVLPLIDAPQVKDAKAVVEMLGFDNADALIYTLGLDAGGYVDKVLLALAGPPRGLVRLVSDRPLRPEDLVPIPRDAAFALAARLDLQQALDVVLSSVERMSPQTRSQVNQALDEMEKQSGINFRRGVLESLGDTWCIYTSPGEGNFLVTGLTAVVSIRSNPGFALAYSKLMDLAKKGLTPPSDAGPSLGLAGLGSLQHFSFAGREVCCVNLEVFAPSWCVMPGQLVMALTPQNVKAYLSRREHKSLATLPDVAGVLPAAGGPVMVGYTDAPKLFEAIYPLVSIYAPMMAAAAQQWKIDLDPSFWPSAPAIARHLRPTVTTVERNPHGIQLTCHYSFPAGGAAWPLAFVAASGAASLSPVYSGAPAPPPQISVAPTKIEPDPTAQIAANLTHVGEGIGKYAKQKGTFPAAYIADAAGKPLLSWRVAILPYLGQEELYKQFRLNEPWDSEHNRKLAARMPACFQSKVAGKPDETNFLAVCGEKAVFPGGRAIRPAEVTDGLDKTVMVVTATKDVVWTKPEDFAYDEKNPLAGLAIDYRNGALALRCDGKVCHIPSFAYPDGVRAVFTRAGGEILIPVGGAVLNDMLPDMLPTGPAYQAYPAAAPTNPAYQATPAPTAPVPAPKATAPAPPAPGPPAASKPHDVPPPTPAAK
jgi:hypothetical protein